MMPRTGRGRVVSGTILAMIAFALAVPLFFPGCEKEQERKELSKEARLLLERRRLLEEAIQRETAGKTELTREQEARAASLWVELRKVQDEIAYIENRMGKLE